MLQGVIVCCMVLQDVAECCSMFGSGLKYENHRDRQVCWSVFLGVAECCGVLWGVVVCCRVLQSVAVSCSVMQCVATCSEMVLDAEFVAIDGLFIVYQLNIKLPFN